MFFMFVEDRPFLSIFLYKMIIAMLFFFAIFGKVLNVKDMLHLP